MNPFPLSSWCLNRFDEKPNVSWNAFCKRYFRTNLPVTNRAYIFFNLSCFVVLNFVLICSTRTWCISRLRRAPCDAMFRISCMVLLRGDCGFDDIIRSHLFLYMSLFLFSRFSCLSLCCSWLRSFLVLARRKRSPCWHCLPRAVSGVLGGLFASTSFTRFMRRR